MPPRQLNLNCLIEGQYEIFQVTVKRSWTVDQLKNEIKKECATTLKDDDAHTLELWKPKDSIPADQEETLAARIKSLEGGLLEFADKLKSTHSVIESFSTPPPKGEIHIIVKASATERPLKRHRLDNLPPHTPPPKVQAGTVEAKSSPPRLTRQQTEESMTKAFEGFEEYIEYLATGKLDAYLDSTKREDKVTDLNVYLPIDPSLLIHDLGKHPDQERIQELFIHDSDACDVVHLFSASGSGKTRLSLEGLCSHWGLYISCRTVPYRPSGSNDFNVATEMLQTMSTWSTRSPDFSNNASPAYRAFAMLLCARLFILKRFMQRLPINTDVAVARRRWVLAQILPPRLEYDNEDLFVKVLRSLWGAKTDITRDIIRSSMKDIKKDLFPMGRETRLFVVIDEAQVAAEYLKFFRSSSRTDLRPILREMVDFLLKTSVFKRIILSGTGLSMERVKNAVGAVSAKSVPNEREEPLVFTNVGRFTRDDSSQEIYIARYLNLSKDNISDRRLLERMKYWFSGRYRLTASLLEIFLHSENVPRHRVLTSFAQQLTGFTITDAIELEANEPSITPSLAVKIKEYRPLIASNRLFNTELPDKEELIGCLVDVHMRWTLGSDLTFFSVDRNMHDMIELGVGFLIDMPGTHPFRLDATHPVYISEPLVVLSLSSLFEKRGWTSRKEWMIRSLRTAPNASSQGFAFENVLPLVLMECFGGKFSPLADAFRCSEKLGSRKFTLVSLKRVASGEMQCCPVSWNAGSSDRLGLRARNPKDVLKYLDNPDGKAFLFPDNHMGANLLCLLQDEETGELVLVALQSKLTPDLNATNWRAALDSVTPELFYTMVTNGKRGQYAAVSYPDLADDLKKTLEKILGKEKDGPKIAPEIGEAYRSKLRQKIRGRTQAQQQPASDSTRQTPRFLRIIVNPEDKKALKHLKRHEGADVAVLRWHQVKSCVGEIADSLKTNMTWIKF